MARGIRKILRTSALALLTAKVYGDTKDFAYQFNTVAITGGGYTPGIVAHPAQEDLYYARTDIGSAYRWSETLNKWIPLTDFISAADDNLLGTESVALDPQNPERLYLAQGRYLSSDNAAFFVSDDYGQTFEQYAAPFAMGANELGRNNGERMAVNPFDAEEVWMGSREQGLWRSGDRARTWENVTNFPDAAGEEGIGVVFVVFDPEVEGRAFVGAFVGRGLYWTNDGGESWEGVSGQPRSWNDTSIAVNATSPPQSEAPLPMRAELSGDGTLYVTYGDAPGPYGVQYGAVFAYDTHAWTSKEVTPTKGNVFPSPYEPQTFPVGGYCGLSISKQDPSTLVVASLDRDPGPAIDSIYLSRDAGETWKDISQLSTPDAGSVDGFWGHPIEEAALDNGTEVPWLSFEWSPPWNGYGAPSPIYGLTKFGWWTSAVTFSPSNPDELMYATGATIWATNNLLESIAANEAPTWYVKAPGIEETVTISMASPNSGPAHLLSGEGDINGFSHTDLDVPQPMFGLPVFQNLNSIDWAGQNASVLVRTGVTHLENTAETGCHQGAYSTDAGQTWSTLSSCIPGVNSSAGDGGTIAIDASGTHLVWSNTASVNEEDSRISNASGPYYSSDMGMSWHSPKGLSIQTRNFSADRVREGTFYALERGMWYVSRDGGASYDSLVAADVGLPQGGDLGGKPEVVFDRAGELYLSLGAEGVYYTDCFGRRWRKVTAAGVAPSLFTLGARAPHSPHPSLYLYGTVEEGASDPGLYRSDDNGASWVRVDDDGHRYGGPTLIQGDSRTWGRVFVGTGGRGIVRAELAEPLAVGENVEGTGGI